MSCIQYVCYSMLCSFHYVILLGGDSIQHIEVYPFVVIATLFQGIELLEFI